MPSPHFQAQTAQFVKTHQLKIPVGDRLLDLVSEIGEIAKEVLSATGYGQRHFRPGPNWELELGDAFFSLICIANSTDVDLISALRKALQKYETRLNEHGDAQSRE